MDCDIGDCAGNFWDKSQDEQNRCSAKMYQLITEGEHRTKQTYQNKLVKSLLDKGHTLFGGYVYKTVVNGDESNDIDVSVPPESIETLLNEMQKEFKCNRTSLYEPYARGNSLLCPFEIWIPKLGKYETSHQRIDIITSDSRKDDSDIFKLQYKQVNGIPTIVDEEGDDKRRDRIVKELQARQFKPWDDMRIKDRIYFGSPQWTNLNEISKFQKIKSLFSFKKDD